MAAPNKALQLAANALRGLSAAEIGCYRSKESLGMRIIRLLAISTTLVSALAQATESGHPQSTELSAALSTMQHQESDKFVVVELDGTNSFFQYAANGLDVFYFDVPTMSLSAEQLERAKRFFSSQGVKLIRVIDQDGYTGEPLRLESFQKIFNNQNVVDGVALGLGFMIEVIGHESSITVIRGWE